MVFYRVESPIKGHKLSIALYSPEEIAERLAARVMQLRLAHDWGPGASTGHEVEVQWRCHGGAVATWVVAALVC